MSAGLPGLGLRAQVKRMFFDRRRVERVLDKRTRRVLGRAGAYCRRAARWSIRPGKGTSAPGRPPVSHTGLLRRGIYYAFEPGRRSVVVGPVKLRKSRGRDVPSVLEHGGLSLLGGIFARLLHRRRRVRIAPRPYMQPALEKTMDQMPRFWREAGA